MIGTHEYPAITSEDLIGLNFSTHPTELPITSLFGRPAAVYSRGLPDHVRHSIQRAVCDLGYRYGVTDAVVELKTTHDERGTQRIALIVHITYRGTHA